MNDTAPAFQPGDTVRHSVYPELVMRVTAVDDHAADDPRPHWVCCAFKPNPDQWHHERYAPGLLELVERKPAPTESATVEVLDGPVPGQDTVMALQLPSASHEEVSP